MTLWPCRGHITAMPKITFHVSLDPEVKTKLDAMATDLGGDRSALLAELVNAEHQRWEARRRHAEAEPLPQERVATIWMSLPPDEDATPYRRAARALYPKAERLVSRQRRGWERDVEISVGVVPTATITPAPGPAPGIKVELERLTPADLARVLASERAIGELAAQYAGEREIQSSVTR